MATPLTRRKWLAECEKLAKVYEDAMTNPKHTDTSRSGDLVDDDFAPIWDESILLAEHEAVQASVAVGGWLSAALDDPNVCDAMKADVNRWFSAGFLYLDEVRKLMQTEREALEVEIERLRGALRNIRALATKRQNVWGPDGCLTDIECFASAALAGDSHDQ